MKHSAEPTSRLASDSLLAALRRRRRQLTAVLGVWQTLIWLCAAIVWTGLFFVADDLWRPTDSRIRAGVSIAYWSGLAVGLWIAVRAWRRRLPSAVGVAVAYERASDVWQGRLIAIAEWGSPPYSPLQMQTVDQAAQISQSQPLPAWRLRGLLAVTGIIVTVILSLAIALPRPGRTWLSIGTRRILWPLAAVDWPQRTRLQLCDARWRPLPLSYAIADSATSGVELVVRDLTPPAPPQVRLDILRPGRRPSAIMLNAVERRAQSGAMVTVFPFRLLEQDQTVRIRASADDDQRMPWHTVVRRRFPQVESIEFTIQPPGLAPEPTRGRAQLGGPVPVFAGSLITLLFEFDQPLDAIEATVSSGVAPLVQRPNDHTALCELEVPEDASGGWELVLQMPFAAAGEAPGFHPLGKIAFEVRPDLPPEASIISPSGPLRLLPDARVPITAQARDDLAIESLKLWSTGTAAPPVLISAVTAAPASTVVRELQLNFDWSAEQAQAVAGQTFEFSAQAEEQRADRPPASSDPLRIDIVTPEQKDLQWDIQLSELAHSLRRISQSQIELADAWAALRRRSEASAVESPNARFNESAIDPRSPANMQRVALLSQTALKQAEELVSDMSWNRRQDTPSGRSADVVEQELSRVVAEVLPEADRRRRLIDRASSDIADLNTQEIGSLERLWRRQAENLSQLAEALEQQSGAGQWRREFDSFRTQLQTLRRDSQEAGRRTVSREVSQLSGEEQQLLQSLAERCAQTATEFRNLRDRLLSNPSLAPSQTGRAALTGDRGATASDALQAASAAFPLNQIGRAIERLSEVERWLLELDQAWNAPPASAREGGTTALVWLRAAQAAVDSDLERWRGLAPGALANFVSPGPDASSPDWRSEISTWTARLRQWGAMTAADALSSIKSSDPSFPPAGSAVIEQTVRSLQQDADALRRAEMELQQWAARLAAEQATLQIDAERQQALNWLTQLAEIERSVRELEQTARDLPRLPRPERARAVQLAQQLDTLTESADADSANLNHSPGRLVALWLNEDLAPVAERLRGAHDLLPVAESLRWLQQQLQPFADDEPETDAMPQGRRRILDLQRWLNAATKQALTTPGDQTALLQRLATRQEALLQFVQDGTDESP